MGGGQDTRGWVNPGSPDSAAFYTPPPTNDAMSANPYLDTPKNTDGKKSVYDKKELAALIDALSRIGISDLAEPPRELGRRFQPPNYILPMYPPNMLPEDATASF